ncbi:hypothetical protein FHS29_000436 [Saccharothrix tamanrassetensis]|uniref:Uncharacterized protein n=1 Tax=Saccharothrix tamanrassetensis TaxID=1051531 RepID=A0A841CDM7_9PSEU|nr:hypothetical protein [Saccharothrix tamanrassetensis]
MIATGVPALLGLVGGETHKRDLRAIDRCDDAPAPA